jgi:hypothetical protein
VGERPNPADPSQRAGRQQRHPDPSIVGVAGGSVRQLVGESGWRRASASSGPTSCNAATSVATWSITAAREASFLANASLVSGPASWPGRNRFSTFQVITRKRPIR